MAVAVQVLRHSPIAVSVLHAVAAGGCSSRGRQLGACGLNCVILHMNKHQVVWSLR